MKQEIRNQWIRKYVEREGIPADKVITLDECLQNYRDRLERGVPFDDHSYPFANEIIFMDCEHAKMKDLLTDSRKFEEDTEHLFATNLGQFKHFPGPIPALLKDDAGSENPYFHKYIVTDTSFAYGLAKPFLEQVQDSISALEDITQIAKTHRIPIIFRRGRTQADIQEFEEYMKRNSGKTNYQDRLYWNLPRGIAIYDPEMEVKQ